MGRKFLGNRVNGPYESADGRWFIRVVTRGSSEVRWLRPGLSAKGRQQAVEAAARGLDLSTDWNVPEAVDEWLEHLGKSGSASSVTFARAALAPLVSRCKERMAAYLAAADLSQYLDDTAAHSMATRRSYWLAVARFAKWLQGRDILRADVLAVHGKALAKAGDALPWETKAGAKEIGRGKPQLYGLTEWSRYVAAALAQAPRMPIPKKATPETILAARVAAAERRCGAALPALTGMASGELLHLGPDRVDFEGGAIWIRGEPGEAWDVKTASRRRIVDLPLELAADLELLCDARKGTRYLFQQLDGTARTPTWLLKLVRSVCVAAGVRVVSPHGLRGTWASVRTLLSRRPGGGSLTAQADEEIARDMGHADRGATLRRAYKGVAEQSPALRVVGKITGTKSGTVPVSRARKKDVSG